MVSWLDAVAYCNWLSEKEKLSKCYVINGESVMYLDTAKGYRLPTEAEWEYAARGGSKSHDYNYAGSADINAVGWYKDNSPGGGSKSVGQKTPNELGLFDMTGNLWEWCWDVYDGGYYGISPSDNPKGPESGPYRVMRGGAWYNEANYARVYTRQDHYPGFRQNSVGFRVARTYY
jgi:formylglycine-generating enzyme required for sulfatase activity